MKNFLDTFEDLIRAYFDKLLLCFILSMLVGIAVNSSDRLAEWAMGQANTVIGAIIMLTTGKMIESYRARNGNGNGNPPETKVTP